MGQRSRAKAARRALREEARITMEGAALQKQGNTPPWTTFVQMF